MGFVLLAPTVLVIIAAAVIFREWGGVCRLLAVVALVPLVYVLTTLAIDLRADPTSHNLWPFEILMATLVSLIPLGLAAAIRMITATRSKPPNRVG